METICEPSDNCQVMNFTSKVLGPEECQKLLPELDLSTWVYRYQHPTEAWTLSISTQAPPHSEAFSLGGFRIVPAGRAEQPGYDNDVEAVGLAHGMGRKVMWSKLFDIAGPLTKPRLDRIVGGKCVMQPTENARMGNPQDAELLDFAILCMRDFETKQGIFLTTGQDLGHATMSDGETYSCVYLNERFPSSIVADTSKPTGEGNYYVLSGLMNALDSPLASSRVGLVGCGNVGEYVLSRLEEQSATVEILESDPKKLEKLKARGFEVFTPEDRTTFFKRPFQAIAVNASGGSLDEETLRLIIDNETLRVVTGSENLMMAAEDGVRRLGEAGKLYCPAEISGMMGYLTAIEERLATLCSRPFHQETLFTAARPLEKVAERVAKLMLAKNGKLNFEEAAKQLYTC